MAAKRLGLLIVTTAYSDPLFPAVADGSRSKELADELRSEESGDFLVSALFDPNREAVFGAVAELLANRGPDDVVLLYFAGHLIKESDGTLFLALRESSHTDLANTAIPTDLVQQKLRETCARYQIVILDSQVGSIIGPDTLVDRDAPIGVGPKFCAPERDQAILATSDYLAFCIAGEHFVAIRPEQPRLADLIVQALRSRLSAGKIPEELTIGELVRYLDQEIGPDRRNEMICNWVSERAAHFVLAGSPKERIDQIEEHSAIESETPIDAPESSPLAENVKFTAYRPAVMRPEQWRRMIVFMHLDEDLELFESKQISEKVETRARQVLGAEYGDYRTVVGQSRFSIVRDCDITLVPEVPGIQFNPPRRSFLWATGLQMHEESFFMRAPLALAGKIARGRLSVFLGQLLLAEMVLAFRVADEPAPGSSSEHQNWEKGTAKPFRKIFASYSHQDVAVVETMERHIQAIGYEYLRDVVSLRSGQHWGERLMSMIADADIFQLFWSRNSAQSAYVEREWRYAIGLQREAFVRPAYWEIPMPPPPEPLSRLHFYLLPGTQPISGRNRGEERASPAEPEMIFTPAMPGAEQSGARRSTDELEVVPTARPPAVPVSPSSSAETRAGEPGLAPLPVNDPTQVGPGTRKARRRGILGLSAILGTVIAGCFVLFLSLNPGFFGQTSRPVSSVNATPQPNGAPIVGAAPSATAVGTPIPPLIPPASQTTPTSPSVSPSAEPSATSSPDDVNPSTSPSASPDETASPSASNGSAHHHRLHHHRRR
jgi:TIR domain/Caspase domain